MMLRPAHYLGVSHLGLEANADLAPMFKKVLESGVGCGMSDEVIAIKSEKT
jgi:hypothetical protein